MIAALLSISIGLITFGFAGGLFVAGFTFTGVWTLLAALAQVAFGWCRGCRIEDDTNHVENIDSKMTPIAFPAANKILTAPPNTRDIDPLPVHTDGKQCLSCWSLTWKQRLQVLLHGRVWLCTLTGSTQPPVWLDASKEAPIPTNQNR